MLPNNLILVRGAGDLATGVIHRLWKAGFSLIILETDRPTAIRRQVSLCEAVYEGSACVEGVTARRASDLAEAEAILSAGEIPLLIDPAGSLVSEIRPKAVIDAIIAKRNLGTFRDMAPLTVALGPGFEAGVDVDYVIETCRGHNLGRVITSGAALPNTGVPGIIAGFGAERVIHAPATGILHMVHDIGDYVTAGEAIALIHADEGTVPVLATLDGLIRGLIREGFPVKKGLKIADIDPRRSEYDNCFTISDKARCIAGSVLEVVCAHCLNPQG
ncbi:MAG: EF2563 family selenium-dependent molybdenum hydroxylase system protein [Lachnospiraceae bacterium]|nr:EF2563 family selenium-dependent molybdenum hydroxylase system protein [Lachnospiraceae bacterium]